MDCVWSIFPRALGFCYLVSLSSLSYQLPALSGEDGLDPLSAKLSAYRRDFGLLRSLFYFPTLFHLSTSDFALWFVPALGAVCGALAALGGPYSPPLLAVCWLCLLSVDAGPSTLVYPWDSLLLEGGFLALFLPAAPAFDGTLASAAQPGALPSPLLSFAFRALLWRLLMGFGKLKFLGSGWQDRFYIRNFLINQPMVSPLGFLAHHVLPGPAWVAMLGQMFVIECIAPFGLFLTGLPRLAAAGSIAALMAGIWATGNYGYFNLLTAVVCIAAADGSASGSLSLGLADLLPPGAPLPTSLAQAALHWRPLAFAALYLPLILPASAIQFCMNSWINLSWAHWGGVHRLRLPLALQWTQPYSRLLRALGHFRTVSGYGVFPPSTSPPQRWALCFEGSADGLRWQRYHYRHYLSSPATAPAFLAPHHPRLDHAIFYESFGASGSPMSILGHHTPYAFHSSANAWVKLQVRLLQGSAPFLAHAARLFAHNPFPSPAAPPRHVRVVACQYTPHTLAHAWGTGQYWAEACMGVQLPALSLDSLQGGWPLCDALPVPEEFWCEYEEWRRRAGVCSQGVSAAEYEEAWELLEVLRQAAGEASAAASPTAAEAAAAAAAAAPFPVGTGADDGSPVIQQVARRHCLLPLPPATLAAARKALAGATALGPSRPLPLPAASALFTWRHLPATVSALRSRYTLAALARIRGTLARMAVPLLRASALVFDRVLPTQQQLASELQQLPAPLPEPAAAAYLGCEQAMGLPPPRAGLPSPLAFAGNDDAALGGSMGSALRWQAQAHRVMLVQGRQAYEAAVRELLLGAGGGSSSSKGVQGTVVSSTPLALHSTSDHLAQLPRPAAFAALTCAGQCLPQDTGTELGTFLLWALSYDTLHQLAVNAQRVASQSRVKAVGVEGEGSVTFLPATLALMPRVQAHVELQRGHVGVSSLPQAADARGFLPPCAVPLWKTSADQSTWTQVKREE